MLGRRAGLGGDLHRLDHLLARRQAELDDDVGQRARDAVGAASAAARRSARRSRPSGAFDRHRPQVGRGLSHQPSPSASLHGVARGADAGPRSKLSAPWATRIARPSTTATPSSRAAATSGVGAWRVDEVDDMRAVTEQIGIQAQRPERVGSAHMSVHADGGRVHEQIRGPRARDRGDAERGRKLRARARARGSRPRPPRPPRAAPRPPRGRCRRRRARPRCAPGERDAERGDQPRRVGVLGLDRAVGRERQRVRGADLARAARRRCRRARAPRACAGPSRSRRRSPTPGSARTVSSKSSGGTGSSW